MFSILVADISNRILKLAGFEGLVISVGSYMIIGNIQCLQFLDGTLIICYPIKSHVNILKLILYFYELLTKLNFRLNRLTPFGLWQMPEYWDSHEAFDLGNYIATKSSARKSRTPVPKTSKRSKASAAKVVVEKWVLVMIDPAKILETIEQMLTDILSRDYSNINCGERDAICYVSKWSLFTI